MKRFLLLLAGTAAVAGCSTAVSLDAPPRDRGWMDAGTPATSVKVDGETRYYKDENGVVWDDRGKKRDNIL
jgi:uncharacterized protein YceK